MCGRIPPICGAQALHRRPASARDMLNGHQRKSRIEYDSRFGLMKIASLLSFATRHISQAEGESARLCRATKALVQKRVGIDSVQSWRCGKHLPWQHLNFSIFSAIESYQQVSHREGARKTQ